jgi:hypothetical protein
MNAQAPEFKPAAAAAAAAAAAEITAEISDYFSGGGAGAMSRVDSFAMDAMEAGRHRSAPDRLVPGGGGGGGVFNRVSSYAMELMESGRGRVPTHQIDYHPADSQSHEDDQAPAAAAAWQDGSEDGILFSDDSSDYDDEEYAYPHEERGATSSRYDDDVYPDEQQQQQQQRQQEEEESDRLWQDMHGGASSRSSEQALVDELLTRALGPRDLGVDELLTRALGPRDLGFGASRRSEPAAAAAAESEYEQQQVGVQASELASPAPSPPPSSLPSFAPSLARVVRPIWEGAAAAGWLRRRMLLALCALSVLWPWQATPMEMSFTHGRDVTGHHSDADAIRSAQLIAVKAEIAALQVREHRAPATPYPTAHGQTDRHKGSVACHCGQWGGWLAGCERPPCTGRGG